MSTALAAERTSAPALDVAAAKPVKPRPRLWLRVSIARGNLVQVGGITAGSACIALAAALTAPAGVRFALAIVGWLAVYDCTHSIGHFLVGRAVGIRFRFYGIRGTDHPEDYPHGLRQLMSVAPFWSVITDKVSMRAAAPWRKALMFAAGETCSAICSTVAAYVAAANHVPGGAALLTFAVIWNAVATVVTAITPKGDYAKALRALRVAR